MCYCIYYYYYDKYYIDGNRLWIASMNIVRKIKNHIIANSEQRKSYALQRIKL